MENRLKRSLLLLSPTSQLVTKLALWWLRRTMEHNTDWAWLWHNGIAECVWSGGGTTIDSHRQARHYMASTFGIDTGMTELTFNAMKIAQRMEAQEKRDRLDALKAELEGDAAVESRY